MTPLATWLALGLSACGLVALAFLTASRPKCASPSGMQERAEMWQRLHGTPDIDPLANPLLRLFLRFTHAIAAPIARVGVQPDVLTLFGVWMAALAAAVARLGGRWCAFAGMVVIISALTDGVDGAVAGFTGRETTRGQVLDSVADRVTESLFFAAIVLAGGSAAAAVAAMGAVMLLEYTRARATVANDRVTGPITVGERPTRVIGIAVTLVAMGVTPDSAGFIGLWGPIVVAVVTTVGWAQLVSHIARWK